MKKMFIIAVCITLFISFTSASILDNFDTTLDTTNLWGVSTSGIHTLSTSGGQLTIFPTPIAGQGYINITANKTLAPNFNSFSEIHTLIDSFLVSGGDLTGTYYLYLTDNTNKIIIYQSSTPLSSPGKNITEKIYPNLNKVNYSINGGSETEVDISSLSDGSSWYYGVGDIESDANVQLILNNITYTSKKILTLLDNPDDIYYQLNDGFLFNASITPASGITLSNATLNIYNLNGSLYSTNFTTLSGTSETYVNFNNTIHHIGSYLWNINACGTSGGTTYCNTADASRTIISGYKINSQTYNSSTYQTSFETFTLNLSSLITPTILLNYDGVQYQTTRNADTYSRSLDINSSATGSKNFFWEITINDSSSNTTALSQTINPINFVLCNSTINTSYLNLTFQDEINLTSINASIPSAIFTYWIGSGNSNKTYNYINNVENSTFQFCFTPNNRSININPYIQYTSLGYQQRIFTTKLSQLSSSIYNKVLYLLSNADGVFQTYIVYSGSGTALSGVEVNATRVIGSNNVVVGSGTTDDFGSITMWLSPNFLHTVTFFKEGYPIKIKDTFPTQGTTNVFLISNESNVEPTTDYTQGVFINILPTSAYLDNGTSYNFVYNISTNYQVFQEVGFNLTYSNGSLIGSNSSTKGVGDYLTLDANTSNSSRIYMNYYYTINGTTITHQRYWIINIITGYGLTHFFSSLSNDINFNLYGILGSDGTGNFSKAFISMMILILITGILGYKYGFNSEPLVMGVLFGLVLFLNSVNLLPSPDLPMKVSFGDFLAYIIGLIALASIIREEIR